MCEILKFLQNSACDDSFRVQILKFFIYLICLDVSVHVREKQTISASGGMYLPLITEPDLSPLSHYHSVFSHGNSIVLKQQTLDDNARGGLIKVVFIMYRNLESVLQPEQLAFQTSGDVSIEPIASASASHEGDDKQKTQ